MYCRQTLCYVVMPPNLTGDNSDRDF